MADATSLQQPTSPLEAVNAAFRAGIDHTVIVVTGSEPLDPVAVAAVPPSAIVLAADGGLDHALAAGLIPAGLVGDLDSITPEGLAWAEQHSTVERHDPRKDQTDTELALAMAIDLNPARLVLLAGGGDRLDHTLGALGALGHPTLTSIPIIEGWWGRQRLRVLHGPGRAEINDLSPGSSLSVLAAHGPCEGVTITGVEWPLTNHELDPLVGLGISNMAVAPTVSISVLHGVLTVFLAPLTDGDSA
jgi:thiamine pyrophosphokinase